MNKIDSEIIEYYTTQSESERLNGLSIEKLRTQELISRHLPAGNLKILDIGGGAGVYSFWLSEMGHSVYLVDALDKHVQQAIEYSKSSGIELETIQVGDARNLAFDDESFDIVLILGPLYHLTEQTDRVQALLEASRVLKPNGLVITAVISRYASMMDGFHYDLIQDPEFIPIMNQDLTNGQHRGIAGKHYFTTSYFHLPEDLESELLAAGFASIKLIAIESFADSIPDLEDKLSDKEYRSILFQTITTVEQDRSILGMSPHIMGIGVKP